ncbi:MAG: ribosomal-processing cysteine protease Prp [Clostridia bacterium]|nr:ribosomal-processing cysteine protease Prp [Clostridia bacterium]
MTKVVFYRSGGTFWGFEETGHAGYGDAGEDILCSALSAMTMLIVNTVEIAYASNIDYDINEGATKIKVSSKAALPEFEDDERKRYAVSGLFMAYYYQLNDLTLEYGEFLEVEVQDRDYI